MRLDYIAKRVGLFFVCVWVAASLNFFLPHAVPGGGGRVGPLWDSYLSYVSACLRLDFGYSSSNYPTRVNDLIAGVSLATLILDLMYPLLDPRIRTGRA